MSVSSNNFFTQINKNVSLQTKSKRISVKRSNKSEVLVKDVVPSGIKDIVEMVEHKKNYHNIREPKSSNTTLFDVNIQKVPLHVKKKYDFLYKRQKPKPAWWLLCHFLVLNLIINFIMNESLKKTNRAKSALPRNYTNIELHACLDEAKLFKEYDFSYG